MSKDLVSIKMAGVKFSFKCKLSLYHVGKIIEYIAGLSEEDWALPSPPTRNRKGQFTGVAKEDKQDE